MCVCVCVLAVYCVHVCFYCPVLSRISLKRLIIIIGNGFGRRRSLCYLRNNVDVCVGGLRRTTTKPNSGYLLSRPVLEGGGLLIANTKISSSNIILCLTYLLCTALCVVRLMALTVGKFQLVFVERSTQVSFAVRFS